jgi:hypothetical protein
VLIEHGRWTRGLKMDDGDSERELRRVEPDSILAFSNEKPSDVMIGIED